MSTPAGSSCGPERAAHGRSVMPETSRFVIEDMTVRDSDTVFVSDLSVSLGSGDALGITGPAGAGKASLIYVLAGLAAPHSGRLHYADHPVAPGGRAALGLTLQHDPVRRW